MCNRERDEPRRAVVGEGVAVAPTRLARLVLEEEMRRLEDLGELAFLGRVPDGGFLEARRLLGIDNILGKRG